MHRQRLGVLLDDGVHVVAAEQELLVAAVGCGDESVERTGDVALGERVFERLAPDDARLADLAATPRGPAASAAYIDDILERTTREPDLMRALSELRLEGVRRPALGCALAGTLHRNFALDVMLNTDAGLPGGRREIALLHFAIDGLLFDRLTTSTGDGVATAEAAREFVDRILRE